MAIDVKLKPVSINFTLKDHIYDVLRESILKVDIYDADEELRLDCLLYTSPSPRD